MTTETKPALSLHRKLAQVMYEAERIPKNGTAPVAMGGYKFVQVGDAADYIRKALAELGVTMMPTAIQPLSETEHATAKGGTMTTYTVRMDWTITDGDSGESILIQSVGTGSDTGDKFASKATTSAMKYALLSGFLLSTGDDIERDDTSDRQSQRPVGEHSTPPERPELVRTTNTDGLIGKLATSGTQDFNLRQGPDGEFVLPFRIKEGNKAGQIVLAEGDLAVALEQFRETVIGQTVTVWGTYSDESSPPKADGFIVRYKVLHLTRIQTPDFTLPAMESETVPLFADDDLSDLPDYA